jgi:serine/threonine protein kinase
MSEDFTNALPIGTEIDTYRIERVLGEGGFGITYLVRELNLGKLYAIKELLPDGIAIRQGGETTVRAKNTGSVEDFAATRKYFISEARILAGMNHPAVVKVHRLMEANGTCYMVMDYVEGDTLGEHLKKRGGVLSGADEFQRVFYPLMDGLDVLHNQGIIHRDVKPGNIMIQPDGSPVLLDFGAATQVQSKTMTITQMLSAGYSPFEQYTSRAKQGPYTDIYALGATMHKCITGEKPDDASDRVYGDRYQLLTENEAYIATYGTHLLEALDASLRMDMTERPQTVAEWRTLMESGAIKIPKILPDEAIVPPKPARRVSQPLLVRATPRQDSSQRERRQTSPLPSWLRGSLIVCGLLGVFVLVMILVLGGGRSSNVVISKKTSKVKTLEKESESGDNSTTVSPPSDPTPAPPAPAIQVDLSKITPADFPAKVELKVDYSISDANSGVTMRLRMGTKVKPVRVEGSQLVIQPVGLPIESKIDVDSTNFKELAVPRMLERLQNAVANKGRSPTLPTPPVEPVMPSGPAAPEPPPAAGRLHEASIVDLLKSDVQAGKVTEFKANQVTAWKAGEKMQFNGDTYKTGRVTFKTETILGVQEHEAIALIEDGKIYKWVWAKTKLEMR